MSNRVLLGTYRLLSFLVIPGFIREKHYRENLVRLERTDWDFWTGHENYIENQSEWGDIRFGVGKRQSMAYAGCEIMATYNARKALGEKLSRQDMAELICSYEARGAALFGKFGVAPTAVAAYFRKQGFCVETTDGRNREAVERIAENAAVMIVTAYNDKNDITAQIHTVCVTRNRNGDYLLHNAYRRDAKGRYTESAPYGSLQEAVTHISGGESKLIYLIGIAAAVRNAFGEYHIFNTTSTKNSVSLLEACSEPPYFSAAAAMAVSPSPSPLCFVER